MSERVRPEPDPYWGDERELSQLIVGRHQRLVHVRSHEERERYGGVGSETLFALQHRTGERTYLQSRFYFHAPPESSQEQRLADGQVWFYATEQAIVLWELVPAGPWWRPDPDPREDFLLRTLWLAYEQFLCGHAPLDHLGGPVPPRRLAGLSDHDWLPADRTGGLYETAFARCGIIVM